MGLLEMIPHTQIEIVFVCLATRNQPAEDEVCQV